MTFLTSSTRLRAHVFLLRVAVFDKARSRFMSEGVTEREMPARMPQTPRHESACNP